MNYRKGLLNFVRWLRRKIRDPHSELWSLDVTIAKFVLPRLKEFSKNFHYYPDNLTNESEWIIILQKIIRAMELVIKQQEAYLLSSEEEKEMRLGLELFGLYFTELWS